MPGRRRRLLAEYDACPRCAQPLAGGLACEKCGFTCDIQRLAVRGETFPEYLTAYRPAGVRLRESGEEWRLLVWPLSVQAIAGWGLVGFGGLCVVAGWPQGLIFGVAGLGGCWLALGFAHLRCESGTAVLRSGVPGCWSPERFEWGDLGTITVHVRQFDDGSVESELLLDGNEFGRYLGDEQREYAVWTLFRKAVSARQKVAIREGVAGIERRVSRGIVVFAHGSRVEGANEAVRRAAADLAREGGFEHVEPAFLELGQPDLAGAVDRLVAAGVAEVTVIPYFLTLGVHLERDLPELVRGVEAAHPGVRVSVTPPLDGHAGMTRILVDRARGE